MKPMLPSSTSWFSRAFAIALLLVPAAAHAQSLPKGYASDESPSSPPATVATTTTTPAAPELKSTTGEDTSTTATAPISTANDDYADTDPSALTDFQEPLQGYGSWVTDDSYGTVWVPDTTIVGSDFAPYQTGGYWSLTDDDQWLWVSTYDWGYVPFHYGRWIWIASRGWAWIPGRTYAPSWAVWRTSEYGYIGWAPMPPSWYWWGGSAVYFTTIPSAAYVFCPTSYVFHSNVSNYVVHDKDTVSRVAAHSRPYKPANPTVGTNNKAPDSASAGKSTGSASRRPSGPSMKEAGVPDSAVPSKRPGIDSRAKLFAKKSTTAQAKALVKTQRSAMASMVGARPVSRAGSTLSGGSSAGVGHVSASSSLPSGGRAPSAPSVRPAAPITVASRPSQPVHTAPRPSQPVYTAPRASAPVSRPSVSVPRATAPVSRPSFSAPRVSAPSRPSFSAPRVSTPHFGGGGARFGGGHRR